jgi:hypothetical protein
MSSRGLLARTGGRRPPWRWRVSAIALLCLLGQTSTLAHRLLVQHATCTEHGESVHVTAVVSVSPAPTGGTEQPAFGTAVVEEADQHEHCSAADTRGATPRLFPDQAAESLPSHPVALPPRDADLGSAVAAYLIAPKTSPPRTVS